MQALGDPGELVGAVCGEVLARDGYEAAVNELVSAELLATPETSWRE